MQSGVKTVPNQDVQGRAQRLWPCIGPTAKAAFPIMKALARPDYGFMAVTAGMVVAGIAMGAIHVAWDDEGTLIKVRKVLGVSLCVVGGFLCWTSVELPRGSLTWEHSETEASNRAKSEKRPLIVDFTAEWCGACKELAKHTFSDPRRSHAR